MSLDIAISKAIMDIVKGRGQVRAVASFAKYAKNNNWPFSYSMTETTEAIRMLIDGKLVDGPETLMLNLLMGMNRKQIKLTYFQKERLEKIISIIKGMEKVACAHKTLVIAPFIHGGGFCMPSTVPELICLDCGLNVTLGLHAKSPEDYAKNFGITIKQKNIDALHEWAKKCKRVISSNGITSDPTTAYNNSPSKWPGKIPFEIKNIKLLDSRSGI